MARDEIAAAEKQRKAVHVALEPRAVIFRHLQRNGQRQTALARLSRDGLGHHMGRALRQRAGKPQQVLGVDAGSRSDRQTRGVPPVSVPVLSSSSVRARAMVSSAAPLFTSTPRLAARESPATIATGTARISGHGVATT
jgi:hypothetical protein